MWNTQRLDDYYFFSFAGNKQDAWQMLKNYTRLQMNRTPDQKKKQITWNMNYVRENHLNMKNKTDQFKMSWTVDPAKWVS